MNISNIIQFINNSPYKVYGAFAGGGQHFVYNFLNEPNASKTILGFEFPYNQRAFDNFIYPYFGSPDFSYASSEAADLLAKSSFNKGAGLGGEWGDNIIGVGVAASLATENEREGRTHKIFVKVYQPIVDKILSISFEDIPQNKFTRKKEDEFITWTILHMINIITLKDMGIKAICLDKLEPLLKISKFTQNSKYEGKYI